jgi:thymidine phosphorylase
MRGLWKGKQIEYTPGRVMCGLRSGACLEKATRLIEQNGGRVDYISKSAIDVLVDPRRTLDIAATLDGVGEFRFVTPEIVYKTQ